MQHQAQKSQSKGFWSLLNFLTSGKTVKQRQARADAQCQAILRDDDDLLAFLERA